MSEKFASIANLKFLLYDVFDAEGLVDYPLYADHGREIFDLVLDTGLRMGKELLFPAFVEMDRQEPRLENGRVKVHPMVRQLMKECGDGGWMSAHLPVDRGGQGLPNLITMAFRYLFSAANYSASVYPSLTIGAAHLIETL